LCPHPTLIFVDTIQNLKVPPHRSYARCGQV
jgi:hypothetical protein